MSCIGHTPLKRADVEKWSDDLSQVMADERGRKRFDDFLEQRQFDDARKVVKFVNDADSVLKHVRHASRSRHRTRDPDFQKSLKELVILAEELDFYEQELDKLREVEEEEDRDRISDTVRKSKASAMRLLEMEHKEFAKHLLKEYDAMCKRNK